MEPGRAYAVEIHLPPTCNLLTAGQRIRRYVSGSNVPRLDVTTNSGEPV